MLPERLTEAIYNFCAPARIAAPSWQRSAIRGFTVQIHYGFSTVNTIGLKPSGPVFGPPGYEINLLYIAGLLVIASAGPGAASVGDWFKRRKGDNPLERS